jgi:hypothetical protein
MPILRTGAHRQDAKLTKEIGATVLPISGKKCASEKMSKRRNDGK